MISTWGEFWKLGQVSFVVLASSGNCALAQVTPDGTLPNNSIVTPSGNTSLISGGTQAGSNLFHSFEQFSVPPGGEANFNNALDIQNIITRVTGSSISNIDGLLRANGTANLFLLNPNGIIFGSNATLNIGGSFLASTASSLNFANGKQFRTTAPQTTPLLMVNVPLGLQYEGTAGSILNQSRAINNSGEVGLAVQPGKTLALLGGDVSLDNGNLQALGGRVELGGVAGAGTVGLNVDGNNLNLSFPDGVARADVSLSNGSQVDVRANGGGSIAINAGNLNVLAGSKLLAGIREGLQAVGSKAGDVTLNATDAITIGPSSEIQNQVNLQAIGDSGDINLTAASLSVIDSILTASTWGQGNAGSISVQASGSVSLANSQFYSLVLPEGMGRGGNIDIHAGSLSLTDGAELFASTAGVGNAGTISVRVNDSVSLANSGFLNSVAWRAVGNGGDITINAGSVSLTDGAYVYANNIGGKGDAADITINAGSLSLSDGAQLSTSSIGNGTAGNIEVAADSIRLNNRALLSSDTIAGQGSIGLRSQDLVLRGSNITTNATGTASGGNITIDTGVLAALDTSDISANSANSFGGRVTIKSQGIIGTEFRLNPTPKSDITATGGKPELSGTVEINNPDVDPSLGLVTLPTELVDVTGLIATGCLAGVNDLTSKFIITGRGGLPPTPREALRADIVQVDLGTPMQGEQSSASAIPSTDSRQESVPTQLVEASGWMINNKGEVVLIATAPTATLNIPWLPDCNAPKTKS